MGPVTAYLSLGSNLGPREATLAEAARMLDASGVRVSARSSLYLTEPVGGPPQDWFVNQVLGCEARLAPDALLATCLAVEQRFGRVRGAKDGPRTLDVDVLLFGNRVLDEAGLVLPHPRMQARRFVLLPLAEIAPELVHPRLLVSVRDLLATCTDASRVILHAPATAC